MAKWELLIAVADEADLKSGHKRKKQGDIIAFRPAGWAWGRKEVKRYLIVPVDGLTKEEAHDLCQPYYEGGVIEKDIDVSPKILAKRRYSIPLSVLKAGWKLDLNEADVFDTEKEYQPLKDEKVIIDFSEKVSICKDNMTGTFKYAAQKVI